jgi:hypothetical protein
MASIKSCGKLAGTLLPCRSSTLSPSSSSRKRILAHKGDEIREELRKLHNVPHNLYSSPNAGKVIKSGMMERGRYVNTNRADTRNVYKTLVWKPEALEDVVIDGRNIKMETCFIWV